MSQNEQICRRVAGIMGEASAAAKAIAELERRRLAGETVQVTQIGNAWVVCAGSDL